MEELNALKDAMKAVRPTPWEEFPDLSLYMDQVLSFMPRQLVNLGRGDNLTAAMINNYIKDGVLPRAEGKRYNRTHLAYLTAICALKQVLSVRETHQLIQAGDKLGQGEKEESVRQAYEWFREALDRAMGDTAAALPDSLSEEELPKVALELALRSYADKLACQYILSLLPQPEERKKK